MNGVGVANETGPFGSGHTFDLMLKGGDALFVEAVFRVLLGEQFAGAV